MRDSITSAGNSADVPCVFHSFLFLHIRGKRFAIMAGRLPRMPLSDCFSPHAAGKTKPVVPSRHFCQKKAVSFWRNWRKFHLTTPRKPDKMQAVNRKKDVEGESSFPEVCREPSDGARRRGRNGRSGSRVGPANASAGSGARSPRYRLWACWSPRVAVFCEKDGNQGGTAK